MAAKSSNPKVEHKSRSCYPIVLLPVLIQAHLPRQIVIEKSVPVEPRSVPTRSLAPLHRYFQGYLLAFWLALVAVVLRFFNVYTHNGVAVASVVVMALALVLLGKEMDDDGAALAAKQRRIIASPQFQTIEFKQWQVADWETVLTDRVRPHLGVSTAPIGASEPEFAKYLQKYFGAMLKPSYTFSLPNSKLVYSADFCLVLPSGLSFCIEVDEPYVGDTGEPHHCIDQMKDAPRDNFFLAGNWVVMRFSEKQVVLQPVACCFLIAKTIDELNQDSQFTSQFKDGTTAPQLDPQWTVAEAQAMANTKYRSSYRPQKGSSQPQKKKVAKQSPAQISM
jgi:hypothetical protein